MKKNFLITDSVGKKVAGFTLAEVLITLTVIGVIAALTIPSLITNIQDAQLKTAWKKAYSDFSQATSKIMLDNGGTLNGVFQNSADLVNKYTPYFSYTKACPPTANGCWHMANQWYNLDGSLRVWGNTYGIDLANGDLITLALLAQDCSETATAGGGTKICGYMFMDINGFKGPNTIGKDIFEIWIKENGLSPTGFHDSYVNTCDAGSTGMGCSAKYLMQ